MALQSWYAMVVWDGLWQTNMARCSAMLDTKANDMGSGGTNLNVSDGRWVPMNLMDEWVEGGKRKGGDGPWGNSIPDVGVDPTRQVDLATKDGVTPRDGGATSLKLLSVRSTALARQTQALGSKPPLSLPMAFPLCLLARHRCAPLGNSALPLTAQAVVTSAQALVTHAQAKCALMQIGRASCRERV